METVTQNSKSNIAIGSDHAGFMYKKAIITYLLAEGFTVNDSGTFSEESVDYPDFAHPVALQVSNATAGAGILICGSGNGVCMAANKHAAVRAALCWNEELAELARTHNNANILCIPARYISENLSINMVNIFLKTPFEGGRHQRRVEKISA